jgi:RNA polymerase sigma factor (sigma-70 family)
VWETSDEALLAGYATGDPDAAAVFVRRFQGKAVGLASMITRDRVEAEEIAQDAFVRAWKYAASFDPRRGSVSSWLLTIVRNTAIDRVRMSGRRHEVPVADVPNESGPDGGGDPLALVDDGDDTRRIVDGLRALPDDQRETLLAVTMYGYSARELSDATNVPLGTVKTRVRLGLRKLRDQLGAETR